MPSPDASGDVQGVPVWRMAEDAFGSAHRPWRSQAAPGGVPHVAHRMDAEAQAARREAVYVALSRAGVEFHKTIDEALDAVLKTLGLS